MIIIQISYISDQIWIQVGQGTYSNVYKARDKDTGKIVALKKVHFDTTESESVKFMAREIMILQKLDHPNVLKLEGLATSRMHYSLYLVFNFMQSDLTGVISRPGIRLTEPQVLVKFTLYYVQFMLLEVSLKLKVNSYIIRLITSSLS